MGTRQFYLGACLLFAISAVPLPAFDGGCRCLGKVWTLVPTRDYIQIPLHTTKTPRRHPLGFVNGVRQKPAPNPTPVPVIGYYFFDGQNSKSKKITIPFGTGVKVINQILQLDRAGRETYPIDELEIQSGTKKGKHVFMSDQDVMMMIIGYEKATGTY
jgi:hypothetical protein